ncbi:hypothetical protein LTR36_003190 [Oleoguttula mirabilis]|uniref:Uncharacterized protein n=1 Tax=Oleoguttula mirabilis TaxID=1507867 RepID=A0AAV9JX77_9PEZI|nr:hypothetical protein LTR36_003190 [Oleoguttula mirabilis]
MAAPSLIPNHPQAAVVDSEGDAFPSGSVFYLDNVCSGFQQSLAFDTNLPGTSTWTGRKGPNIGFRWTVEYSDGDRTKIALQNYHGGYLAITGTQHASRLWLSNSIIWWYAYQSDHNPPTFWLSSSQSPDAFLHTWDCNGNDGADVLVFTNRDVNSGNTYGLDYERFDRISPGLSWQFRPSPEYLEWKQNNRQAVQPSQQRQPSQQGVCCNECGQRCPSYQNAMKEVEAAKGQNDDLASKIANMQASLTGREEELTKREQGIAAREQQCQATESDMHKRGSALTGRENDFASKEKSVAAREEEAKKQEDIMSASREEVRAAEQRVKDSEQAGPADHLARQQESDKLAAENKQLRADLEAAKRQIAALRTQPQQSQQSQHGPSRTLPPSHTFKLSIRHGGQTLPPLMLVKQETPAQSLQKGYNPDLLERFEAGRKAMKRR